MFENKKDSILLRGALISAARANNGSLMDVKASENALSIIFNSINKIINHSSISIEEGKESIKAQLDIHKRLHAAVFFTTLRTYGMSFNTLENFYSSVAATWPPIDFKFFFELNFRCDWGEFFIKCASQLPSDILLPVFRKILTVSFSKDVERYTWHLMLQTLTVKLLNIPCDDEIESSFQFHLHDHSLGLEFYFNEIAVEGDEVSEQDLLHNKPQEMMHLKEMYNNICNLIFDEIKKSNDLDLMKILLHEVKTLLKNLLVERKRDYENISRFPNFINIYNVLINHLKSDDCQENLKVAMSNPFCLTVKHSYATTSWSISESYLCFLLSYYWNKIYNDFCFKIELSTKNCIVYSEMIINTFLYETLNALNPLFVSDSEIDQEHLNFLYEILQLDFEGASFVAEMLLSKPALMERNNGIQILEENSHAIDFSKMYPFILQSIKAVKSQDSKCRLLKIFYKILPVNNVKIYNDILITILTEHGFTEEFQLPDFSDQLSQVFRTTPTIKQAEETFPFLFLQNPLIVLKRVIDQTLIQGPEGRSYIEPLKYVHFACTYQENGDSLPVLIGILNDYFEKSKLAPWESKNMTTLYKFLMKLQSSGTHIMVLDVFLNKCIIPKLQHDVDNIEIILECLCTSLNILIRNKTFLIGYEPLISLISSLGSLLNDCILTQNGRLKASVLPVVQVLNNYQCESYDVKDKDKEKLLSYFRSLHEVVCEYMKVFIPRDILFLSKSYHWISCCNRKSSLHFEEMFSTKTLSYPALLQTLVEVLPHLTKEEWLYSIDLIKVCCKNDALRDEILHSLNKPFHICQHELDKYVVTSCLITSLHLILQENKDPVYLISCFASSLKAILIQEETKNTFLLMTILLECCYLIECIPPDISSLITLVLLDLKKYIISSCSSKTYKDDCKKLMSCAVKCLPDFCDKNVLLTS